MNSGYPNVKCPACRKKGDWLAKPEGPFCSPRCKQIDLGRWFAGENCISQPLTPDVLEELADEAPLISTGNTSAE